MVARRRYTAAEVERGLIALVYCNGSASEAHKLLKADGLTIPAKTLESWKDRTHAEKYQRIRREEGPRLRQRAIDAHLAAAARELAVSAKMTVRLEENIDEIPPRDLPGGIRNLETSVGINIDKAQLLAGQPTEIHQTRSADELLRSLQDKLGTKFVEGTAEEEEVPSSPELPSHRGKQYR